jgi:protein-S-isoprenylcysteine O-methyltransferase Ste14
MTEPLVFQPGAAATVFDASLASWLAFELIMSVRQRRRLGGRPARDPSGLVLSACFAGAILLALRLGRHGPLMWPGGLVWPPIAGLLLILGGISLRAWSIATLGRFFQYRIEVQTEHRVVAEGPYRYVRHPSYSGIAFGLVGVALASGDVLGLVAVAALGALGLTVRIRAEERQLTQALGAEYESYAASRKRLVPGIW